MSNRRAYWILAALAIAAYVVSTVGWGTFAKVSVAGDSIGHALSERVRYANFLGAVLLFSPFAGLAAIAGTFAKSRGAKFAFRVFASGSIPLAALYFIGYTASEKALLDHQWTASALSVGLLPFQGAVLLAVVIAAAMWASRRKG